MKLHLYTLTLDSLPFLPRQLEIFEQLKSDWHWHVIEGVADSVSDTNWVAKIPPRLSRDGTAEFINSKLLNHPRVSVYRRMLWPGKTAMCNAAISTIKEECCLMQVDADEFWKPEKIDKIVETFANSKVEWMRFRCRYWLGPKIIAIGDKVWSNRDGEWLRAIRHRPGNVMISHEPPRHNGIGHFNTNGLGTEQTKQLGLVFDHYAYYFPSQIQFKTRYYKYDGLESQWNRLQQNTKWPVKRLADFMPFVGEGVGADLSENHPNFPL